MSSAEEHEAAGSVEPARPLARDLFRVPVLRHVLAAEGASKLGDWFTFVAASVVMYDLGGGRALGAFHIARAIAPVLLGPRAGALSSRLHPIRLMIGADVIRAMLIATVGMLAAIDALSWPLAVVLFSISSALGAVFRPAQMVVVSTETPDDLKPAINGYLTFVQTGALSVAPILAGLAATTLGSAGLMWIDAGTYALSAVLLIGARSFEAPAGRASSADGAPSFSNVARSLLAVQRVRAPFLFHIISHVIAGAVFLAVVGIAQGFDDPDRQIGLLTGTVGIGSLVGALVATRIASGATRNVMAGATLLLGPLVILATNVDAWLLVAATVFLLGVLANLVEPFAWSEYQQSVPENVMGASFGFIDATTTAAIIGASAAVGWLLDSVAIESIGLVVGGLTVAASLVGLSLLSPSDVRRSGSVPNAHVV